MDRKALKKHARGVVKRNYLLLVAACLIAALLGVEFTGSLSLISMSSLDRAAKAEEEEIASSVGGDVDLYAALLDIFGQAAEGQDAPEQAEGLLGQVFGESRGVFASIVNGAASGKFLATLIVGIHSVVRSERITVMVFIGLSLAFTFLVWMFVKQNYIVALRRLAMECQEYENTPFDRFGFLLRCRRWLRTAWVMIVTTVFHLLWSLTVVGAVIKYYSYYLVPYIAAENPSVKPLEAITLSRRMMKGHKWECFVFGLTFLGWDILSWLTLGLVELFYAAPYKAAFFAGYYARLRQEAIDGGMEGTEILNDAYLFDHAPQETLDRAYADIEALRSADQDDFISRDRGFRHFMAANFGVSFYSVKQEEEYDEKSSVRQRLAEYEDILSWKSYPVRLFPAPEKEKTPRSERLNYLRHYSLYSLILMYFVFAVFGWLWEVSIGFVQGGVFINRGVLHGPWLPIYGTGATIILVLLARFRKKPALEFTLAIVLSGCVEYFTGWYLEMTHGGMKWWDYSGYFLNINGRICAEGLLTFGIAGVAVVYLIGPLLDEIFRKIKPAVAGVVCAVLVIVFGVDNVYSSAHPNEGEGITDVTASAAEPAAPARRWDIIYKK